MQSCNKVFVSLESSFCSISFPPLLSLPPSLLSNTQEEARRHSINVLQILKRRSDGWSGLGMSGDPVTARLKEGRKSAQRKQEDIEVRWM